MNIGQKCPLTRLGRA